MLLSLASFRLDGRRPTANNFERGERTSERTSERVSDEGKMYSRVSNLRLWPGTRGARGRDWSAVVECGAELYYGNYMINTTRPWALSSPSWSSFQSRSSALAPRPHQWQESRSSRGFVPVFPPRVLSFSSFRPTSRLLAARSAPSPFPRASIGGLP